MNRQQRRASAKLKPSIAPESAADVMTEGVEHHLAGRLLPAEACYRRAIGVNPDHAHAFANLGNALQGQGKLDEAVIAYRRAVALSPHHAEAYANLGAALVDQGKSNEAVAACQSAIDLNPDFALAHSNLGAALILLRRGNEAAIACRRAIAIKPDIAEAHYSLGVVLQGQGKLDEAIASYRRAFALRPNYAQAYSNLGAALVDQGKLDEAIAACRRAIAIKPDYAGAHGNLLLYLNYNDRETAESLFAEHREWGARLCRQATTPVAFANARQAGRRLRIGYVSPDLREHPVSRFFEPLLREHDREAVEIFCYAEVARPDAVTARLRELSEQWLTTAGLTDDALAERIRADGIDILVDLAGHTANNRLGVFARKAAPVQATWLGYPNTTGLDAIDYQLVDAITDPVGADAWASETLVRLPDGYFCYGAAQDAPEPAAPPSLMTGVVTFGSFNNPAKLSASTLDAWARLLTRLPHARLLLKGKPFADAGARALLLGKLGERGIAADRIELEGWSSNIADALGSYGRLDIALDPFPYNGATTTCDTLWMGVPVVTLRGDRHAARVGASLLAQVGLPDLVADSVEDYVEIAAALAGDSKRLTELRRTLRPRMAASPLCDAPGFARKMEAAYRDMWQTWRERRDDEQRT